LATTGLGICTSLVTLFVTTSQPRGTAHGDGRFLRLVSLSAVLYPPSASSNDSVLHTPPTCFMHVRITIRISGAAQLMRQKSVKANKFLAHHRPGPSQITVELSEPNCVKNHASPLQICVCSLTSNDSSFSSPTTSLTHGTSKAIVQQWVRFLPISGTRLKIEH
jgi:hypothetical protein